jgi:hypothetical protein
MKFIVYPNKTTLLEYENEAHKSEYGLVNSDILNSFISSYKFFNELLNIISEGLNNNGRKEVPAKESIFRNQLRIDLPLHLHNNFHQLQSQPKENIMNKLSTALLRIFL